MKKSAIYIVFIGYISNLLHSILLLLVVFMGCSYAGFTQITTITINSSGNWTCPPGVTSATIECWGAGGAGGGVNNAIAQTAVGGGGSGGAYTKATIVVTPLTVYPVTIGAGGTGGTGIGGNGGATWFSTALTLKAVGGLGGSGATITTPAAGAAAVTTGNVGGTINWYGGAGGTGATNAISGGGGGSANITADGTVAVSGTPGTGSAIGAIGVTTSVIGNNGNMPGSGGSGARRTNAGTRNGGNGGNGLTIITYTTPSNRFPFSDLSFCTGAYPSAYQTVSFSLKERLATDFNRNQAARTLILTLPTGFEFNTAAGPTVTKNGGGSDITALALTSVTTSAITITLSTSAANPNTNFDEIFFNNFQIRASAMGIGNLVRLSTNPGTFTISGSTQNPLTSESFGFMYSNTAAVYNLSEVTHYITSTVNRNCESSQNAVTIKIRINISGGCPPPDVTQFNFSTMGDAGFTQNPTTNIANAKVYYNGHLAGIPMITSNTTVFGSASNPNGAFTINGSQKLNEGPGDYYFFLVYDIKTTANIGDGIDASLVSFVIDGSTKTDMITPNPAGNRIIIDAVCSTPDIVNPPSNLQSIPINSYVIPMDNTNQSLVAPFNLKAYGLIHSLLMNDIPVKWVILSGKTKDAADFTANASRIYPTAVAAANKTFKASAFIIDSTWINRSYYSGIGKTATQVINDYYALGAGNNQVAIYKLTNNETLDVRYTLHQRPKIAVFSNGGNQAIHKTMLDAGGITNYFIQSAGNFTGLAECYTFCSEAHWSFTTNPDINPVDNVLKFVNEGGNFLAQCAGIDLYENHQPSGGHFHSDRGVSYANTAVTNTYSNTDMAFNQFEGGVTTDMNSTIRLFWPSIMSNYVSKMYYCISPSLPSDSVVASAAHLAPSDSIGGNVFYLGGHDYSGDNLIGHKNGVRMYLNATLIPAARPTAFMIDAGDNRAICIGESTTLGGNPTGGSASCSYFWSPPTGLDNVISANPVATPTVTTTYTVIANDNGCPGGPSSVVVTVNSIPTANVNDTAICNGKSTTLTATGGITYLWNTGDSTASVTLNPTTTTTYTVTAISASSCTASAEAVVTVNTSPTASAGNATICNGKSVTLTASGGGNYTWTTGDLDSTTTVSPTSNTTYTVTVTNVGGCSDTHAVVVTVNTTPTANVTDTTICNGKSTTLTATGGGSYFWSTGDLVSTTTVNPSSNATYTVTVTNASSCTDTHAAVVTVNITPTANVDNVSICNGDNTTLTATGGGNYVWSTSEITNVITVTPITTTTYTVTVTNATNCTSTDNAIVTVNALPTAEAGPDIGFCVGNSTTLTASGGVSYSWTTGETTATITVSPIDTTTYTVTVTNGNNCTATDQVVITVGPALFPIVGNDFSLCLGQSATLTAGGGEHYTWNTSDTTTTITVTPGLGNTTFSVSATNGLCSGTDEMVITVNPLPTANAGIDQTICLGKSASLNASGGVSYTWNPSTNLTAVNIANPVASPSADITYTVIATDIKGCTDDDAVIVFVNNIPIADAGIDVSICNGKSTSLTASGGNTYLWSTTAITPVISVNPIANTTYTVTVTNTSTTCTNTDDIIIIVKETPTANAGTDKIICKNKTTILTASGGTSYNWITGDSTDEITVSPAITTVFIVTVTNAFSCTATDDVQVTVNNNPLANAGSLVDICKGKIASLTASGGSSYQWNTGATSVTISVSPAINTTYSVIVTNIANCTATDDVVVTVNPLPTVSAGSDIALCSGKSGTLTASGNAPYSWSSSDTTAQITISPLVKTTYTVTVTNGFLCTSTDNAIVTVNPNPTANAGFDIPICIGKSGTLIASGGWTYLWNTSDTTEETTISPIVNTTYTITVTNGFLCTSTDEAIVRVNPNPTANAGSDATICFGDNEILAATGGETYIWSSFDTSAQITVSPLLDSTFTVTVTNEFSCTSTDDVIITVNTTPTANIADDTICFGKSTTLTASGVGNYSWSTGSLVSTTTVNPIVNTTYTVTVTNAFLCTDTHSTVVIVNTTPTANISDDTICYGKSTTLTATGIGNYVWSTGSAVSTTTVNPILNTTYTVTVTNTSLCTDTHSAVVTVNTTPTADATNDTICNGKSTTLTATGIGNYIWSTGSTVSTTTVNPIANTTYTVTVTNASLCTDTHSAVVTVNITPTANVADATICNGKSTTLTATGVGNYTWSTGSTISTITVNPTAIATYTVTVTNTSLCTDTHSAIVTVNTTPTATIADDTICYGKSTTLIATGIGNYSWSTGSTISTTTVNPIANTTYTVTVTNASLCTDTHAAVVIVNITPTANIADDTICLGNSTTLIATGGVDYSWSTGDMIATTTVSPIATATYIVTVSNAFLCTDTHSAVVTVNTTPTTNIPDDTICYGKSTTLSTSNGIKYIWSTGDTISSTTVNPIVTTTYTVTITNISFCTVLHSAVVTVNAIPTANVADATICNGNSTMLTATGIGNYSWSTGDTIAAITVSPTFNATYTVTVTNTSLCTDTHSAVVTVNITPTANVADDTICYGKSTTLSATGGVDYSWSTGDITATTTVSPTVNATYTVTVTNASFCTDTHSAVVIVNTTPTATITDDTICYGKSTTLIATGGFKYSWSTGDTSVTITVSPTVNATYTVTVTNASLCTDTHAAVVTVITTPTANIADDTICNGKSAILTATGGDNYLWSTGDTIATTTVSPTVKSTYTVTVTNASLCTDTHSAVVTVNISPTASSTDGTICYGKSTTLSATGGGGYLWSTGDMNATTTVSPIVTSTYTVTVTNASLCTDTHSAVVTVNAIPTANVEDDTICYGKSTTLIATGIGNYLWSTGSTISTTTVNPIANTIYTVTVTNTFLCTDTHSAVVTVNITPTANVADDTICIGKSTTLTATGGVNYLWSTGDMVATTMVSPMATETYTVTVTNAFLCTDTHSAVVTVNTTPTANIADDTICYGKSTTLTATGGDNYSWSTGSTISTTTVNPTANATYTVTATNLFLCTDTHSAIVTVRTTPTANISDDSICNGKSTTLVATGGGIYSWSTGDLGSTTTVNPIVNATYTVTVTNASFCTDTHSAIVKVNPIPTIVATDDTVCIGMSTTLIATGGKDYLWSTGSTVSSTAVSPIVETTYTITVTNEFICTSLKEVVVSVDLKPTINAGLDKEICFSENVLSLNAQVNVATGVAWSGGLGVFFPNRDTVDVTYTPSLIEKDSGLINFIITSTGNGACAAVTDTLEITIVPLPIANAGLDVKVCANNVMVSLNGKVMEVGGGTWSSNGTGLFDDIYDLNTTYTPSSEDTINGSVVLKLTTTGNGFCNEVSDSMIVTITPKPTVDAGTDQMVCANNAAVSLNGITKIATDGIWTTNGTGVFVNKDSMITTYTPSADDTIKKIITLTLTSTGNGTCLEENDSMLVTITPKPLVNAGPDIILCSNILTAKLEGKVSIATGGIWSGGNGSYSTNNTDLLSTYIPDNTELNKRETSLVLTSTGNEKCIEVYDTVKIFYGDTISILMSSTPSSCKGCIGTAAITSISNGISPFSYKWNNNESQKNISKLCEGKYTVTVIDSIGCSVSDFVDVLYGGYIKTGFIISGTQCVQNNFINFQNTGSTGLGKSFEWTFEDAIPSTSNAENPKNIKWNKPGTYAITQTIYTDSCTRTSNAYISIFESPVISFTKKDVRCFDDNSGAININVNQGAPSYSYLWSTNQKIKDISNIKAGNYTITATDVNGCSDTESITITEPPIITIAYTTTPSNCGSSNGAASVLLNGGTPAYTIVWNNGSTTTSISNVKAGIYTITVTDSSNCSDEQMIGINDIDGPLLSTGNIKDVSCPGGSDGEATIIASGGSGNYTFLWSNGSTGDHVIGLKSGMYSTLASDDLNCKGSLIIEIKEPLPIIKNILGSDISCSGYSDGTLMIELNDTVKDYTYLWNTGQITAELNNVSAGTYIVTVSDPNGCDQSKVVTIGEPSHIIVTDSIIDVSCNGDATGYILLNVKGGTPGYNYTWSNLNKMKDIFNLTIGKYTVTILDANKCTDTLSYTINEPEAIVISTTSTRANCGNSDGSITASAIGGVLGYSFLWSTGDTVAKVNNISSGSYFISVTDKNNCLAIDNIKVDDIKPPVVKLKILQNISCPDGTDGVIHVDATSESNKFIYKWSNGSKKDTAYKLAAGYYYVTVYDAANTCFTVDSIKLINPVPLIHHYTTSNIRCFNGKDGEIMLYPDTSVIISSYIWSNGKNTKDILQLAIGTYTVTVTNSKNCKDTLEISLIQPTSISVTSSITHVKCNNGKDGYAKLSVLGGVKPYQYKWNSFISDSSSCIGLAVGKHVFSITDSNTCILSDTITIHEPSAVITKVFADSDTLCSGLSSTIIAKASGGQGDYTYSWNQSQEPNNTINLTINSLTKVKVYAIDSAGCQGTTDSVTLYIRDLKRDSIQVFVGGKICKGDSTKIKAVHVIKLNNGYHYRWSDNLKDGLSERYVSPISSHIYHLTVSDTCDNTIERLLPVTVFDVPVLTLNDEFAQGCIPYKHTFKDPAVIDTKAKFNWDLADNTKSTERNPVHIYKKPGKYTIKLKVTTSDNCPVENKKNSYISVYDNPTVAAKADKLKIDLRDTTIHFSIGIHTIPYDTIVWDFDDGFQSSIEKPSHQFPDTGTFHVSLILTDTNMCQDTALLNVIVKPWIYIDIPNAFTPDPSGPHTGPYDPNANNNDIFYPITANKFITEYSFIIFNRWDELIFHTEDPYIGWDGYYKGELCQQDVYVYKVNVRYVEGLPREVIGEVILLR